VAGGSPSIFARIIAGEIPCPRVFENQHVLALLDINPLAEGHTLLLPKRTVERLADLPAEDAAELAKALTVVERKVLAVTGAPACNVLLNDGRLAGQEVPHLHFHIIPRHEGDGLGYRWRPKKADPQALAALAQRIQAAP
jgi:histidine triad (HIT) family protein